MKKAGFNDEGDVGLPRQSGVKVNTETLDSLVKMHSSISGCDGSSLLSRTDDKSLSLHTVELQPVLIINLNIISTRYQMNARPERKRYIS